MFKKKEIEYEFQSELNTFLQNQEEDFETYFNS
jgi:hypothetical protein